MLLRRLTSGPPACPAADNESRGFMTAQFLGSTGIVASGEQAPEGRLVMRAAVTALAGGHAHSAPFRPWPGVTATSLGFVTSTDLVLLGPRL